MTRTMTSKMKHRAAEFAPLGPMETAEERQRRIDFEHSTPLAGLLQQANLTLLVSTYQAGKLAVIGSHQGDIALSFHNVDRPMGMAISPEGGQLAVAARDRIWFLRNAPEIASRLEPHGRYSACYLTRTAHVTGEIQAHEIAWGRDSTLWIVNTLFSCLCTLDDRYSFVPRWRPPFVSQLAAEDRCHLNGLAVVDGQPRFVTAMGQTDTPGGWRDEKARSGCVIDVRTGTTIATGFAMPHSPRVHAGRLWLLDSGRGALVCIDPISGSVECVARFPGYTRGLALHGEWALVGLSRIRETSTFGGVPIAENRERLKCGVAIVHLASGELLGQFEFKTGVEEIFDVAVLAGVPMAAIRGPHSQEDGDGTLWVVPDPSSALPPH